ncbi:MAG: NAD(P)/FAD-dependent oxidoreductase, partial [Cellulosilyticaceae bacterium]
MFDVAIIGAGVIGCAIARELAKYALDICVIEKNDDIANGTSKANSGIVHPGEDPVPGSMKAKMNIRGNQLFDKLKEELDFPFKRNGSLLLCFNEEDVSSLEIFKQRGLANGIPDTMQMLNREEALRLEPHLSERVVGALFLPTGGIVCPYELTIALAENAYSNGVTFFLNTEVERVTKIEEHFLITTSKEPIKSKILINAAGVHADDINNMLSETKYHIIARKGEYLLFDKTAGELTTHTLFQLPTKMGKGILVTPTVSGNLLVGPTATDIEDKLDIKTTRECLSEVVKKAELSVQKVPMHQVITS